MDARVIGKPRLHNAFARTANIKPHAGDVSRCIRIVVCVRRRYSSDCVANRVKFGILYVYACY